METSARPRVDLTPLFSPRSFALVGATNDLSRVSMRPIVLARRYGYPGRVYAVNPKYERIGDVPCYPSVLDLPEAVDLALVTIPARAVAEVLRQCAQRGVRGVVINTSGFAEVGDTAMQDELVAIAREAGLAMIGPNAMGFVNFRGPVPALWAVCLDLEQPLLRGPVGFVSQSGALSSFILAQALGLGIGMTTYTTTGNEAVLEFQDYVDYLLDDPETKVICGYAEGIHHGRRLLEVAARALERRKPIVLLKTGRTGAGARATASHTGSLAGSDAVFDAACRQVGIVRVESVGELLDCTVVLGEGRFPSGNRVGMVTGSGGGAALVADLSESRGLTFPDLTPATKEALRQVVPPFATIQNPFDGTSAIFREQDVMGACLRLVAADANVDVVFVYLGTGYATAEAYVRDLLAVRAETARPMVVVWAAAPPEPLRALQEAGMYVFSDELHAVKAVTALVQYGTTLAEGPARLARAARLGTALCEGRATELPGDPSRPVLPDLEARRLLAEAGIPVARHALARSRREAAALAAEIGFPVAMKVASADLPHKTEVGAVQLGVQSPDGAERAYGELLAAARQHCPDAAVDGVLVEELVAGGVEAIVGAIDDAQFGPTVLFGLGGVFAEIMKDTSLRVAPIDRAEALEMIREVKGFPLLDGARGRPKADVEALADVLMRVSELAVRYAGQLAELDLNPVMVLPRGQGVRAVDALITRRPLADDRR